MKTIHLFLILVLLATAGLAAQEKPLVFVTQDRQDFPWISGDTSSIESANPGAAIDLMRAIGTKLGITIEIRRYPWTRCLESELKNGTADGAFLASYKAEREAFGVYPQKYGKVDPTRRVNTSRYSFYRLIDKPWEWDGRTPGNPGGLVGVPAGYSVADDLKTMGLRVASSNNTEFNFKSLLASRLSLVATLELDGDYLLENRPEFKGKIVKVANPIVEKPYYLMLSKQFVAKNPELAEKIWTAAAELRETTLPGMLTKYF